MFVCGFTGPSATSPGGDNNQTIHAVLEEQRSKRQQQATPTSGPELAAMMKVGCRVMRGVDWKWGDQVSSKMLYSSYVHQW